MQTVLEALTDHIGECQLRPQSFCQYRSLVRALPPDFLASPVANVLDKDVREALAKVTAGRFNKVLGLLTAAFDSAVRNRVIAVNPAAAIRRKRTGRSEVDPLTPDELRRVVAECEPWFANYFAVAAGTGARPRELTALRWSDVTADSISVRRTALASGEIQDCPKTAGSVRTVPMIASVRRAIEAQRAITGGRELVFGDEHDKPMPLPRIARAWHKALAACGLRARRAYILRHSFASNALDAGLPIRDVAACLGHSSISQLVNTYSRFSKPVPSLGKLEAYLR